MFRQSYQRAELIMVRSIRFFFQVCVITLYLSGSCLTYTVLAEESKTNDSVGSLANEVDQSQDSLITGHVTKVESVNSEDDSREDLEIIEDIDAIDSSSEDFDGDVLSDQSDEGTESSDDSLAITSPPRILSLVPCLPSRGQCVEDAEYHLGSVLLGPLNRTQGRQLIAEVRATRRPACYNSKAFDFMRQQRAFETLVRPSNGHLWASGGCGNLVRPLRHFYEAGAISGIY